MDRVESVETKGNVVESVPEFQESSLGNVAAFAVLCLASKVYGGGKGETRDDPSGYNHLKAYMWGRTDGLELVRMTPARHR